MKKLRKAYRWIIAFMLMAVFLLAVVILAIPHLLKLDAVKTQINQSLSQQLGGDIAFEEMAIGFFPKPNIRLQTGRVMVPQQVTASFKTIRAYPRLISLLSGSVHLNRLQVQRPVMVVHLNDKTVQPSYRMINQDRVQTAFKALLKQMRDEVIIAKIEITDGQASIFSGNQEPLRFKSIQWDLTISRSKIAMQFSSIANVADTIAVSGWIDPDRMQGNSDIELTNVRSQKLANFFDYTPIPHVSPARLNFKSAIQMSDFDHIQAIVKASSPEVFINHGNARIALNNAILSGQFRINPSGKEWILNQLILDKPALTVSGALEHRAATADADGGYRLKLTGQNVDVAAIRQASMPLTKQYAVLEQIFRVLKTGNIPAMTIRSQGQSLSNLFRRDRLQIEGRFENGDVFIPGADLTASKVFGKAVITNGILEATHLSATHGNTQGQNGILNLGLGRNSQSIFFQMDIDTDTAELPPYLKRWLPAKRIVKELNLIDTVSGRAAGRLTLSGRTDDLNSQVAVDHFDIKAHYQRLPFPIVLQGNNLNFENQQILIGRLNGTLSKSKFEEVSAVLSLNKTTTITARAQTAVIALNEIAPWLRSVEPSLFLLKGHRNIQGQMHLVDLKLKGPLITPTKWSLQTRGMVEKIRFDAEQLSSSVEISKGSFSGIINPRKERFVLQNIHVSALDSTLQVNGTIQQFFKGLPETDITFAGQVQSPLLNRLSDKIPALSEYVLRTPVEIKSARLRWQNPESVEFSGKLLTSSGPKVSWNLKKIKQGWQLMPLVVQDQKSSASISLRATNDMLNFNFSGRLEQSTLEKLLIQYPFNIGLVNGNFELAVDKRQPLKTSLRGELDGWRLTLPWKWADGFFIDQISIGTELDSPLVTVAVSKSPMGPLDLSGFLEQTQNGIDFSGNLSADTVEWSNVKKWYDESFPLADDRQNDRFWNAPVNAKIELAVNSFIHNKLTWQALKASVNITPAEITFDPFKARLCDIETSGRITFTPQKVDLAVKQMTQAQPLDQTLGCLWRQASLMDGRFNYQGYIQGNGRLNAIGSSLNGDMRLDAEDGRIYQLNVLSKVLSVLNATEIFRGTIPDLTGEGMAYRTLTVKGILENGQLNIRKGIINGKSMDIVFDGFIYPQSRQLELTILIAPFKTVDFLIKNLPIINTILGGNLITVPIKASGDWNDPDLTYPLPSEIGSGLLGIMKRTVQLPFTVITPGNAEDQSDQKSSGK